MEMTGEQRIAADRQTVWNALNDPEILRASIPGCQELVKQSDTEMTAIAVVKVGPISARFQGNVTLSELDPPNGYRITGEGQGGVAGHARGGALVRLEEDGDETVLHYEVSAQVGGRLAQLGGRMIDATARAMSGAFFKKFAQEIARRQAGGGVDMAGPPSDGAGPSTAALAARAARPAPADYGDPAPGQSRWLWLLCGLLLGTLLTGLFGLTREGPLTDDLISVNTLVLIAVALAAAQGYLLGRQRH